MATVSITGVLVGGITEPLARACAFVDVSKVDVTEWVNTIWGAALLDQDQSSPLTAEDDLGPLAPPPVQLEPDSPILPIRAHIHMPPCSF